MLIVGLAGLLASVACYILVRTHATQADRALFWGCLVLQVAASIVYWQYSLEFGADALAYYSDPLNSAERSFRPGTVAVTKLVQFLKNDLGASYLSTFLFFQAFGMAGIAILIKTFREIEIDLLTQIPLYAKALILLPGFHFWTAFVGKDPILFLSVCLALWASMHLQRRSIYLVVAILVMALVRPHIAVLATFSVFATAMLDRRIGIGYKVILMLASAGAAIAALYALSQIINVAGLTPDALTDALSQRQEVGIRKGEDVMTLPFVLRVLTLLFRPFFFDAQGIFGYIVSVENVIYLVVISYIIINFRDLVKTMKSVAYVRFGIFFSATVITFLSMISFNVGLGLRQKFMAMPALIVIYMTILAFRKAQRISFVPEGMRAPLGTGQAFLGPQTH